MKKYTLSLIISSVILSLLFFIYSCEDEEQNHTPTCSITSPLQDEEIIKGELLTISVSAEDEDGRIEEVYFYIDDICISSISTLPYSYDWDTKEVSIGIHSIKVVVFDNDEAKTEVIISITILGTINDYEGNEYAIVKIGNQVWMAENLKTTHYADGTEIALEAYCYYDNSTTNADTYGALYTWAAAMNSETSSIANPSNVQGACPDGWHLPSDAEWTELTNYLVNDGHFGTEGTVLKSTSGWYSDNGTDNYGFTAIPAGNRHYSTFSGLSKRAYFWSATESSSSGVWYRYLGYDYFGVIRNDAGKDDAYSVRCLQN